MTVRGEELLVNMGPQHPSTHGVLRLLLTTDGEIVRDAEPHIGYLHRCFEKTAENVSWQGVVPYTDRMDYVAAIANEWPYVLGVERLAKITVPERAEYCRVIAGELQRIASHLVFFGTFGLDMGAFTPFLHAFRDREKILDILESVSGARLLHHYIRIGGVMADFTPIVLENVTAFIADMRTRLPEYHQLLSYNRVFLERTAGVGVISLEEALAHNLTGPNLRACGLDWDLRKKDSYSIYDRFAFRAAVGSAERGVLGDCWNRYIVRLVEIEESLAILEQAVEQIPAGAISANVKVVKPPAGEVYARTEGPRGETGFYIVSDGGLKPYRVKAKSPSFCALSGFRAFSRDLLVSDVVALLGSLDIVLGEVDR